ncbi:MAG: hypothetical protein KY469_09315 [Actinobacteria bacterium]|nr:hypothetical protein [Actinomycetota bacterium]
MTTANRRGTAALILALVLGLALYALPAYAAVPRGTASITTARTLLAGDTGQDFTLQVCNPDPGAESQTVHYVSVFPPPDMLTNLSASGPFGWNSQILAGGARVLFYGGTLLPGQCGNFTLTADITRPATDQTREWGVSASNDGISFTFYGPATEGATTTVFKVLKVVSIAVTAPVRAADGTVTAGQTVTTQLQVLNRSSNNALEVTPTIRDTGPDATTSSCPVTTLNNGPDAQTITCSTTFATAAAGDTVQLVGDATATGVDAFDAQTGNIRIQAPVLLQYVTGSLNPRVIVPNGTTDWQFRATFKNLGVAAAEQLVTSGSHLRVGGASLTNLQSPETIPPTPSSGGGSGGTQLTFVPVKVSLADGTYQTVFRALGIDSNDLPISVDLTLDELVLDSDVPAINNLALNPPASLVKGEDAAAGSGRPVTFSGAVVTNSGPCADCTITQAFVNEYAPDGTLFEQHALQTSGSGRQISVDNSGNISGSATLTYTAPNDLLKLQVRVVRLSVLSAEVESPGTLLDTIAPRSDTATTVGFAGDGETDNTIILHLSERVAFPQGMSPADWNVQDNLVADAVLQDSKDINTNDDGTIIGDIVELTLQKGLEEDERPALQYQPPTVRPRAFDRVDLKLQSNQIVAADGIIPRVPVIATVAGKALQNDTEDGSQKAFFTNDATPEIRITSVAVGHEVTLYEGNVGGDVLASGEVQQPPPGQSPSITFTPTFTETDQRLTIVAQAVDPGLNPGGAINEILDLDFTAPTIVGAAKGDGTDITVSLNEPVTVGRNSALDWTVTANGGQDALNVGSVTGSWASRVLTIDDFRYDPATTTLSKVFYEFFEAGGPSGGRYFDRAGNAFPNTVFNA